MEECPARRSFARSKLLVARARNAAMIILALFVLVKYFDGTLSAVIEGYIVERDLAGMLVAGVFSRSLVAAVSIMLNPLIAVSLALLYFKARQSAGETMREILGNYQQEELPATRWQERMMKRLSVRISRASNPR
jgi:hypothetical protein